jgi:DnaK suppressor protein
MNKKLTHKQIEYFKNLFLKQKDDVLDFLKKNQNSSDIDLDGDEIDVIQANLLHTIDKKILEREAAKLVKINSALTKIDNGTFGNCEECDDLIALKRLEARPEAEFCILCAEKAELEAKMFLNKNS